MGFVVDTEAVILYSGKKFKRAQRYVTIIVKRMKMSYSMQHQSEKKSVITSLSRIMKALDVPNNIQNDSSACCILSCIAGSNRILSQARYQVKKRIMSKRIMAGGVTLRNGLSNRIVLYIMSPQVYIMTFILCRNQKRIHLYFKTLNPKPTKNYKPT